MISICESVTSARLVFSMKFSTWSRILHLGDGDVEPLPGPFHDALDHLSLSFEGKIPVEQEFEAAKPDDHDPSPPFYRWAVTFSTT
jgi:hypothetical protein